jgi:hypothetical protein
MQEEAVVAGLAIMAPTYVRQHDFGNTDPDWTYVANA